MVKGIHILKLGITGKECVSYIFLEPKTGEKLFSFFVHDFSILLL